MFKIFKQFNPLGLLDRRETYCNGFNMSKETTLPCSQTSIKPNIEPIIEPNKPKHMIQKTSKNIPPLVSPRHCIVLLSTSPRPNRVDHTVIPLLRVSHCQQNLSGRPLLCEGSQCQVLSSLLSGKFSSDEAKSIRR